MKTLQPYLVAGFILFTGCSILSACKRERVIHSMEEYYRWLNNPENGLVRTKYVNGFKLTVKYLPPDYRVYQEISSSENQSSSQLDSLKKLYKNNHCFLLSIGPDERKNQVGDVMFHDVKNYKEYTERAVTMNFVMEEYIKLATEEEEYKPALSALENIYGLSKQRNLLFVFVPESPDDDLFTSQELDFIYDDELFELGINHFVFYKKDIDNCPQLPFSQKKS